MNEQLSYLKTVTNCTEKNIEVTVRIPSDWGMFTPQGNQGMKKRAETLVRNVLKVKNNQPSKVKYLKCFDKYFKAYERGTNKKTYEESSDTMVREMVVGFAENVAQAVGLNQNAIDDIWNDRW